MEHPKYQHAESFEEWVKEVRKYVEEAGYKTTEYQGSPLVETPPDDKKLAFLNFPLPGIARHIYKEGVLLTPLGP